MNLKINNFFVIWNYGRGLAQFLLANGERVFEVNPRWTAQTRKRSRRVGKSDSLDAHAVAKLVREEATTLPKVTAEDASTVLDLLCVERDALLHEATRIRNQLHQMVLQLSPLLVTPKRPLTSASALRAVEESLPAQGTVVEMQRVAASRRLLSRLRLLMGQAKQLEQEIEQHAKALVAPLTELYGVSWLTAGMLAGLLGPGRRFGSEAELAAYAGVAPVEASSAGVVRHRLNRGGNRRLNAVLHRIALTQARSYAPAKAYISKRCSEGKSWREAVRALKRYIARAVWRLWERCLSEQEEKRQQEASR